MTSHAMSTNGRRPSDDRPPRPGDGILWDEAAGEICTVAELKDFLSHMPDGHTVHLYRGEEYGIYISTSPPEHRQ